MDEGICYPDPTDQEIAASFARLFWQALVDPDTLEPVGTLAIDPDELV